MLWFLIVFTLTRRKILLLSNIHISFSVFSLVHVLCFYALFSFFPFLFALEGQSTEGEQGYPLPTLYSGTHFHSFQFGTNWTPHNNKKKWQIYCSPVKGVKEEQLTKVPNGRLALWLWRYEGGKVLSRKQKDQDRLYQGSIREPKHFFSKRHI